MKKKVYQVWIFFLESIVASGVDVKIVIFPRVPGRCCKNKTKTTRPEAINCRRVSPSTQWSVYTCTYIRSARAADCDVIVFEYLWKHDNHTGTHVPFDVDVHRHKGSSLKEDKYWYGSNRHNMTNNLGYTYVQNQSIFLFKKCVTIILFL